MAIIGQVNKMRIALVSEHASPLAVMNGAMGGVDAGGQNIYVAHVACELGQLGHRVDVFTRREDTVTPSIVALSRRVRVVQVPAGPARSLPKELLLPWMKNFSGWLQAFANREQRLGRRYELLHANFFMSGMACLPLQASMGLPLVMTFHALGKVRRLHQGAADGFPEARLAIEDELVRRCDRIVAECPQDHDDLVTHYGADPDHLDVVPCGFDPLQFHPEDRLAARKALGWDPQAWSMLQLGRLVPRKGVDNVIRGVAGLAARTTRPLRLYIVGGNTDEPDPAATPEIARLRQLSLDLGIADKVVFMGRRGRETLRRCYCAADVFVTTPWYEPFGITPVEAMACATPVIGAAVGGIRSTVLDGETGLLVPPHDPGALAAALATLMSQPQRAKAMGQAGLLRAQAQYTWTGVTRGLLSVYQRALRPIGAPVREAEVGASGRGRLPALLRQPVPSRDALRALR